MDSNVRAEAASLGPVARAGCFGDATLQMHVLDLNTRLLQILVRESLHPFSATSLLPRSLAGHLRRLTPDQCILLGNCPVLLVDLAPCRASTCVQDGETHYGAMVQSENQALLSSARILAWHMARHCPSTARVLLGWSVEQVRAMTSCSLWGLQSQWLGASEALRVRWANRPAVWTQMVEAVMSGDSDRLGQLQLRTFQLIAADLAAAEALASRDSPDGAATVIETARTEGPRTARVRPKTRVGQKPLPIPRRVGASRPLPVNCPE